MKQLETPVLLIVFNRPDETKKVLESLQAVQPKYLYIAQDAPRENNQRDMDSTEEVRTVIKNMVTWPCDIKTQYQSKNLGCGYGPVAAITWFFTQVPQGIILEDDCVADPSFFQFTEELLGRYKDDVRIMHISGNNYQDGIKRGPYSYYFSKYTHNWGWASFARAWKHFNHGLIAASEQSHVWDAAWEKSVRKAKGYGVIPQVNLVQNIGFGESATHTKEKSSVMQEKQRIDFPLIHPSKLVWQARADYYTFTHYFHHNILALIVYRIKKLFK